MTAACRTCAAPVYWESFPFCSRTCRDKHADAVLAQQMNAPWRKRLRLPKPPRSRDTGGKRWCAECGADMQPGSKNRFCSTQCGRDYRAATGTLE